MAVNNVDVDANGTGSPKTLEAILADFEKRQDRKLESFALKLHEKVSDDLQLKLNEFSSNEPEGVRNRDDDELSLHAGTNDFEKGPNTIDPMENYVKGSSKPPNDIEEGELEKEPDFQEFTMEQNTGPALCGKLADTLSTWWNKEEVLSREYREKLDDVLVPANCPFMKVKRLNPAIYNELLEPAQKRDQRVQRQLTLATKAAIPLLQGIEQLKGNKKDLDPLKIAKDLNKSVLALNILVSEGTRKRQVDSMESLGGKKFRQYSASKQDVSEALFDEKTMKDIGKTLDQDRDRKRSYPSSSYSSASQSKGSYQSQYRGSKNFQSPSRRGGYNNNNRFQNQNQQQNQSKQKNSSFFGGKFNKK